MAITKITTASITDGTIATADIADGAVTAVKTTGVGGSNTPALARDGGGGNTSIASKNTWTLVTLGTGILDTDSDYDTSTGKFTPSSAGKYLIYSMVNIYSDGQLRTVTPAIYRNGTEFSPFRATSWTGDQTEYYITSSAITTIMDFNGSSDYIQLYINVYWGGSGNVYLNSRPSFGAIKIIE